MITRIKQNIKAILHEETWSFQFFFFFLFTLNHKTLCYLYFDFCFQIFALGKDMFFFLFIFTV